MSDNLQRLRDERADHIAAAREILKKVDVDKRDLTDEETAKVEDLHGKCERLAGRIALEEKNATLESSLEKSERVIPAEAATERGAPRKAETPEVKGGFSCLGEQLQAVARAARGGGIDSRFQIQTRASSNVPTEGGFLIQQDFSQGLIDRAFDSGQLARRVKSIPIGENANGLSAYTVAEESRATGSRYGGVQVYWLAEGEEKPESSLKWKKFDLKLGKMGAFCKAPDELLQDATALEATFRDAFQKEMGFALDAAIIDGSGVGVTPLGILNSPALIAVPKESGQVADTLNYDNVLNIYSRFLATNLPDAVWLANTEIMPQLGKLNLAVGTGGVPVYLPANGVAGEMFGTLFGRPIIWLEQASALGDKGDLMLVDPNEYLLIRKGGMKMDSSIHVFFRTDETAFRFVMRVNGTPLWDKPVIPYKGNKTKSPFVTTADRA
jgi:HK97 family phage major capsid protein